jgi:Arc/MetJ-type ribon-helix-helix transcriptional regulator
MVMGMATKKYTVTLPEELAEEIRSEVGPGAFSAYVTRAIERQREHDRLGELVERLEGEYGPVTDADLAAAEAERREIERWFEEQEAGAAPDRKAA